MKIYLLDINPVMIHAWSYYFKDEKDVEIVCDFLDNFLNNHPDIECIVSPANAYGLMDGGYDAAISSYFGKEVGEEVRKVLQRDYYGEQVVGTSIIVDIPKTNKKLIHTPTMLYPSRIKDPLIIYYCMRSTLMCAIKNKIKSIVIPAFGGATGKMDMVIIAKMMKEAYVQIKNPPKEVNWEYLSKRNI